MSVDKSLRLQSGLQRQRSVLSRAERLAQLREAGKWKLGDSIFGLPKVRVRRVKRKAKAVAKPEAAAAAPVAGAEAAAPGAPAAAKGAAAPARGVAPAKGAAPAKAAAKPEAGKAAPKK
jgi:small basic protein (TIGR04137 family)